MMMMTIRATLTAIAYGSLLLCAAVQAAAQPKTVSAEQTVSDFYHQYLNPNTKNRNTDLPYSRTLQQEIAINAAICKKYADGPCGWGADRDLYLDAQESDPKLNDTNANLHVTTKPGNIVEVTFDLFPYDKPDNREHRTMQIKMVEENRAWVLDDVICQYTGSERKNLQEENEYYLQQASKPAK